MQSVFEAGDEAPKDKNQRQKNCALLQGSFPAESITMCEASHFSYRLLGKLCSSDT